MTTREEERAIADLAELWGLSPVGEPAGPLRNAEPFLHEICHAVALGFSINVLAPDRVSKRFDQLNEVSPLLGLTYEAQCFAVEKLAMRMLRWERRIRMKRLINSVWGSGFSGQALPNKEFHRLIRRFMGEASTKNMAVKAARHLLRLARKEIAYERRSKR